MKILTNGVAVFLSSLLVCAVAKAETPVSDCLLTGTVKQSAADENKVYVAFRSARPAEPGAKCKMPRKDKLQFKVPADSRINAAPPGSKVEYRYSEDREQEGSWELRSISS